MKVKVLIMNYKQCKKTVMAYHTFSPTNPKLVNETLGREQHIPRTTNQLEEQKK